MTRKEEINIAALRYIEENSISAISSNKDSFIEGAKWADNNICLSSIWNDTSIMPSDNKGIIYLTKNNKLGVLNSIKSHNWDWYVAGKYSIINWAYIGDLIPRGG